MFLSDPAGAAHPVNDCALLPKGTLRVSSITRSITTNLAPFSTVDDGRRGVN
jgi:hypothetical protein